MLLRVNAHDDLNYGAGVGEEIEPGYFHSNGDFGLPCKRFFTEDAIRAALAGLFDIAHLTHRSIDRYGAPKQVWECLARASAYAHWVLEPEIRPARWNISVESIGGRSSGSSLR